MLECKGTNNGGTARDKALRFRTLREESIRLGGIPLIAVLGGLGWARVNDALGPVVRDTEGRVFTLATLNSMLEVAPFPSLVNTVGTLCLCLRRQAALYPAHRRDATFKKAPRSRPAPAENLTLPLLPGED